jgi:hypothetical protein
MATQINQASASKASTNIQRETRKLNAHISACQRTINQLSNQLGQARRAPLRDLISTKKKQYEQQLQKLQIDLMRLNQVAHSTIQNTQRAIASVKLEKPRPAEEDFIKIAQSVDPFASQPEQWTTEVSKVEMKQFSLPQQPAVEVSKETTKKKNVQTKEKKQKKSPLELNRSALKTEFLRDLDSIRSEKTNLKIRLLCLDMAFEVEKIFKANPSNETKAAAAKKIEELLQKNIPQKNQILKRILTDLEDKYFYMPTLLFTILFSNLIEITWKERSAACRVWDLALLHDLFKERKNFEKHYYGIAWQELAAKAIDVIKPEQKVLYLSLIHDAFPNQFEFLFGNLLKEEVKKSPTAFEQALFYGMINIQDSSLCKENDLPSIQKVFSNNPKSAKKWLKYLQEIALDSKEEHVAKLITSFLAHCYQNNTFGQLIETLSPDSMKLLLMEKNAPFLEMCKIIYHSLISKQEAYTITEVDSLKIFAELCIECGSSLLERIKQDFPHGIQDLFYTWYAEQSAQVKDSAQKNVHKLMEVKNAIYKKTYQSLTIQEKRTNRYLNQLLNHVMKGTRFHLPYYYHSTTSFNNVDSILNDSCIEYHLGTYMGGRSGTWFSTKRLTGICTWSYEKKYPYSFAISDAIDTQAINQPVIDKIDNWIHVGFQDESGVELGLKKKWKFSHLCHLSVPDNEVKAMKWILKSAHYQQEKQPPIDVVAHTITDCLREWLTNGFN